MILQTIVIRGNRACFDDERQDSYLYVGVHDGIHERADPLAVPGLHRRAPAHQQLNQSGVAALTQIYVIQEKIKTK